MSTSTFHDRYQAIGPHAPERKILSRMLEQIPSHIEIEGVVINGQTGIVMVQTFHEGWKKVYEFSVHEFVKQYGS